MHGNPMSGVAQLTSNGRPASAEAPLALDSGEALRTEDNGARPGDRRGAEAALGSDQDPWVGRVIDERYRLVTAHSTIIRFAAPLSAPEHFTQALAEFRNAPFGSTRVAALELVFNDWYMSRDTLQTIETFQLCSDIL